ncbi:hypothetical protein JCM3775_004776 [Rhodotorula graminis]
MTDSKHYEPVAATDDAAPPAYEAATQGTLPADLALLSTRATPVKAVQPSATPQMRLHGPRNPLAVPVGLDGKRDWSHGLCAWYERPALTAEAMCCPCLVFNHNRERLVHLTQTGEPHPDPSRLGLWTCLYALAPQLGGIGQVALQCVARFHTRQRYAVRGNAVEDVLVGAFCTTCSLVQESRELEGEEQALRAEGGGAVAPQQYYRDEAGDAQA